MRSEKFDNYDDDDNNNNNNNKSKQTVNITVWKKEKTCLLIDIAIPDGWKLYQNKMKN